MATGRLVSALIAVVVSLVALAPLQGLALPDDTELDHLSVRGAVPPTGNFVGTLRSVACTLDGVGELGPTRVGIMMTSA
jgi:hypothetical protein